MHNLDMPYGNQIIKGEKQNGKCLTMSIKTLVVIKVLFVCVKK